MNRTIKKIVDDDRVWRRYKSEKIAQIAPTTRLAYMALGKTGVTEELIGVLKSRKVCSKRPWQKWLMITLA